MSYGTLFFLTIGLYLLVQFYVSTIEKLFMVHSFPGVWVLLDKLFAYSFWKKVVFLISTVCIYLFSDMDHLLAHCRHYSTILPDNTIWAEYTCASVCHCQCSIWVCGIMAAWHFRTETKCNYLSTFLWSRFTVNFTEKRLISWLFVFFYRSKCRKYKPLTCFI